MWRRPRSRTATCRCVPRCSAVLGDKTVSAFLVPKDVIRHIVVTLDNLPRKKVAVELRPVKPTPGKTAGERLRGLAGALAPTTLQRYAPLVQAVRAADTKQVARIYFHFYPLFQQAYENLGYPSAVLQ